MTKSVFCAVLKADAPAMDKAPYPGELGVRILANVSEDGWQQWLQRLVLIINENQLNTANPDHLELIEEQMLGFLFQEGDGGGVPQGFSPRSK